MYQYVPRRASYAVGHPGPQVPTGPYGIEIVSPRPCRPVKVSALRPPATPVDQLRKRYLEKPSAPPTTPGKYGIPGVTHFDLHEIVLVCHYYGEIHSGYLFGPVTGSFAVTNEFGFNERYFTVDLGRWHIEGLPFDHFSPNRAEIVPVAAKPLLQHLQTQVNALNNGAFQEFWSGSHVLVQVWMPGLPVGVDSCSPQLIRAWVASRVTECHPNDVYSVEVLRGIYNGLRFKVSHGQLVDLNPEVVNILGNANEFVDG